MLFNGRENRPNPGTVLRQKLKEGPHPLIGIFGGTAHHAQLAEAAGFSHFGVSGAHTSMHLLGMPDAGLMTQTELVENVRRICRAVDIPVVVDCDTGFGNALNVIRTVDDVIRAGAAGLFLEDQVAPKRCGFSKGKEVISVEEAQGKLRAAVETRDKLNPDFVIMARTDSRGAVGGGMDAVMERCAAYLDCGVDILYVEALQSRDEIRQVRDAFPDALLRVTTLGIPGITMQELADFGICAISLHLPLYGQVAMYDFLQDVAARGQEAWNDFYEANREHKYGEFRFFNLAGFQEIPSLEERFLPQEHQERYNNSVGNYDPRTGA